MIRAVIAGVTGRMGSTLVRMVRDDPNMEVAGGTEKKGSSAVGLDVGLAAGLGNLEVATQDDLARAIGEGKGQVVIDFTTPDASLLHAKVCAELKVPLVVGSTGFSPADRSAVEELSSQVAVVMAPNMSVGVTLMIRTAAQLAKVLGNGFDVEIVETHHRKKKDAPSGTALRLGEELARALGRDPSLLRVGRQGLGERRPGEIGIQSVRGGDEVGEHQVIFLGEGERIELAHRASSREQFGRGALRAALWVIGRPPGLYDMQNVLGLR